MLAKRRLRVVVASPGDVQNERNALPAVIDELNRGIAAECGLSLELHRWETDAYPGFHSEGPQGLIDPILQVEDSDILIGIFWKRFGTPTNTARSGTEHEILAGYKAWQRDRRPQIMVYFNQAPYKPKSTEELNQWGEVLDFQRRFPKEGLWWPYKGKLQFERLLREHLTQLIRNEFPRDAPPKGPGTVGADSTVDRTTSDLLTRYFSTLADRVSKIYLFAEDKPRELEKIFVELSIAEGYQRPSAHLEFLGLIDAEMRRRRRRDFARGDTSELEWMPDELGRKDRRTVKPDDLLSQPTKAVVNGAPGCGKTTLLRYLAWKTLKAQQHFPVFLELKAITEDGFKRSQQDFANLLFDSAIAGILDLSHGERDQLRTYFMSCLSSGTATIFLDGLDEISGTGFFMRLCTAIGEFARRMQRDNTLIITTRQNLSHARFEGLKELEISPLNQRQIEEFFAHYYGRDWMAEELLRALQRNGPLREILRVPFLLTAIAQLHRQQQQVVNDRLELYRLLVWQLVVQLDREKQSVCRDFRIPDRTGSLKLDFLKYLACERLLVDDVHSESPGGESARLVFSGDMIREKARQFWINGLLHEGTPHDLAEDVKATPLLREVGTDIYAFTHLTIQEYLAAIELSRRPDCEEVFCRAYFNPMLAAMEVLPMTMGLVGRPEKLYAILEQLPESLTYTSLRLRTRGLAYVSRLDHDLLINLVERLVDFVDARNDQGSYLAVVFRSASQARPESLDVLIERLTDFLRRRDKEMRNRAAIALRVIGGEGAIDALIPLLKDEDALMRGRTAEAMGEIGGSSAISALLPLLDDEDSNVRWRVAVALGEIGTIRALDPLIRLLRDDDRSVRRRAAEALGNIGSHSATSALIETVLTERDDNVRDRAGEALRKIGGERAAEVLVPVLDSQDPSVRQRVAFALGKIGGDIAVPALLHALEDENRFVRQRAALALARIGNEHAIQALILLLENETSRVRWRAAQALAKMRNEQATEALLEVLVKDRNRRVRWSAVLALGRIGGERVVNALLPLLNEKSLYLRRAVAEALGRIGNGRTVDALLPLLRDKDSDLRRRATVALGKISGERCRDALLLMLKDDDRLVRDTAVLALRHIGGELVADALVGVMRTDVDSDVRQSAAQVLGVIGDERVVGSLLLLLKDDDRFVRRRVPFALGALDHSALYAGLGLALAHEDEFVRSKAAQAVGYYAEDEGLLDRLRSLASEDQSNGVRIAANDARIRFERKLAYFSAG